MQLQLMWQLKVLNATDNRVVRNHISVN